jgi:hypothetical protein
MPKFIFSREMRKAHMSNFRMRGIFCATMMLALAWLAPARADDVLDRGVHFHIAASPLASALIEFSTQSGIQVAVADADVSALQANAVSGVLPAREALGILLHGTGLEFARVGVETVAIRKTLHGALRPARAVLRPRPGYRRRRPRSRRPISVRM